MMVPADIHSCYLHTAENPIWPPTTMTTITTFSQFIQIWHVVYQFQHFGVKECNGNTRKVLKSMADKIVTICHIIR